MEGSEATACTICLEDLKDELCATRCGHVFHGNCITPWIKKEKSCPICKKKISRNEKPIKLFFNLATKNNNKVKKRVDKDKSKNETELKEKLESKPKIINKDKNKKEEVKTQPREKIQKQRNKSSFLNSLKIIQMYVFLLQVFPILCCNFEWKDCIESYDINRCNSSFTKLKRRCDRILNRKEECIYIDDSSSNDSHLTVDNRDGFSVFFTNSISSIPHCASKHFDFKKKCNHK